MSRQIYKYWSFIVFAVLMVLTLGGLHFFPIGYWLKVRTVHVDDARPGDSPLMVVDRTISHPFIANWIVNIRRWEDGGWVVHCNISGAGDYRADAKFPRNLDVKWWTNGKCHPLPVGKYLMATTWLLKLDGLMPDKSVGIDSNVFEVK